MRNAPGAIVFIVRGLALITLGNFQIVLPRHHLPQEELKAWILKRHVASARAAAAADTSEQELATYARLFERYAIRSSLIHTRYFECPDVIPGGDPAEGRVYAIRPTAPRGASIGERTKVFCERAEAVLEEFYPPQASGPFHLLHVTCTGYRSPSAAQRLAARRGWGETVGITHAYHMGCYAALPAVRLAEGLVAARRARAPGDSSHVDIVHTEMCGLHLDPSARTPEQIVVQTLFADGHVKYSARVGGPGLEVKAIKESILPDSEHDMSWAPEEWGMRMTLSREVPEKIRGVIASFFRSLAAEAGEAPGALRERAVFAVHPGGPRIIQAVEEALELTPEQVRHSYEVLSTRGNMSSATLPHVWREVCAAGYPEGTPVVSFAFGPGLTVFGSVFYVRR